MEYQKYRDGLLKMWYYVQSDDFSSIMIENPSEQEEYCNCGLCNPEFGVAYNRSVEQICPYDKRKANDDKTSVCIDHCRIFIDGFTVNKLKIIMSKFMINKFTKEAIASIKSIAKASRGMKGVSKEAADNHIIVANKIRNHIKAFGGYNFSIDGNKIKASKSEK